MAKKSFEECYYSSTNGIEYLDKITDYVEENDGDVGKYKNSMFCPECRIAELTYVHRTTKRRAFLRRNPSTPHSQFCSYNYEYSSPEFSTEYYKLLTDKQIQDKMDSIMRTLLQKRSTDRLSDINEIDFEEYDNPFIQEKEKSGQRIRKSLRRKNLSKWLDKEIEGLLHVFYGEVKLKVRKYRKKNVQIHFLDVFCQNKKKEFTKRTEIYRGVIEDIIDEGKHYHLVAVGILDFSNEFPKLQLSNKQSILFKVIE